MSDDDWMILKPTLRTKFGQPGSKISSFPVPHPAASLSSHACDLRQEELWYFH
jgi:hypothetical protein